MRKSILSALLTLGCLTAAPATYAHTPQQINAIEREFARINDGENISDAQLEYYLDRSDAGWSMAQISADIAEASRRYDDTPWRPAPGWTSDEVVCSSVSQRRQECRIPFQGTAMITSQISAAPCVQNSTWGQRPGVVWVTNGCRARFGVVRNVPAPMPGVARTVVCQSFKGRVRECAQTFRGRAVLVNRFPNSAACVRGTSWGQRNGRIWVSRNCRAKFAAESVAGGPRPGPGGPYSVTCASTGPTVRCNWDDRRENPVLSRQLSSAPCVEGRTWDFDGNHTIWVSQGCRATFVEEGRGTAHDNDDGHHDNSWVRDDNYSVVCNSTGGGRTVCTWDDRYGQPRMSQQLSQSACVEGRDWGYDRRGELWVTAGCRARFGFR